MNTQTKLTRSDLTNYLHQPKPWLNILAIAYMLIAYYGGVVLLLSHNIMLNAIGTIFVFHGLVYAAFFGHELLHCNVFKKRRSNKLTAIVIRWLTGMCYVPFDRAARGHIGHHLGIMPKMNRINPMATFMALPKPILVAIAILEWFYIPIQTFLYLWWRNLIPFWMNRSFAEKIRLLLMMLVRGAMFVGLGIVSLKALCLYFFAYIAMLTILRFNQAFEHTSDYNNDPESQITFTTFSPMISRKYPWLDLLVLNFSYHNAHHILMSCPWYHLPTLDRQVFEENQKHHLAWGELLSNYHRFRIVRLFSYSGTPIDEQGNIDLKSFYGVNAALPF
jgi:fatty acid desaturase